MASLASAEHNVGTKIVAPIKGVCEVPAATADTARSDTIQGAQEPMICQEEDFESMIPDPEIGKRLKEILERLVRSAYPAVLNAGADYTLMIACSGTPYSWGMSRRGALGQDPVHHFKCIPSTADQDIQRTDRLGECRNCTLPGSD